MYGVLALIESGAVLSSLYLSRSLSIFRPTTIPDSRPKLRSSRICRVHSGRILHSMALLETPDWFKAERVRCLTDASVPRDQGNCVVYWMSRDQRAEDNWAMLYAKNLAQEGGVPLVVAFVLGAWQVTEPKTTLRYAGFMLKGLAETEGDLRKKKIPFHLLQAAEPRDVVPAFAKELGALAIVTDMCPLRDPTRRAREVAEELTKSGDGTPLFQMRDGYSAMMNVSLANLSPSFKQVLTINSVREVDAHNVVPVWATSDKQETMARTIRPKIHARPDFLGSIPELSPNPQGTKLPAATDWKAAQTSLDLDRSVPVDPLATDRLTGAVRFHAGSLYWEWEAVSKTTDRETGVSVVDQGEISWLKPGAKGASDNLQSFIETRMKGFADLSNNPNEDVCSHMSPYFNLGQMSAQAAVMRVKASRRHPDGVKAFVEQGVVRRELSDNFCFYNDNYDNLSGAAGWARESLEAHANDQREWTYSVQELEEAKTHEDLWNAAQLQLVRDGKMHNFLRMYWAKKILEWSPSPHDALERCLFFNDKYELDGRDPNGFTGCAWSVMGIHDMGWKEREVFGKIRYMNYAGCKRKFDVQEFVSKYAGAGEAAVAAGGTVAPAKRKPSDAKGRSSAAKKGKAVSGRKG